MTAHFMTEFTVRAYIMSERRRLQDEIQTEANGVLPSEAHQEARRRIAEAIDGLLVFSNARDNGADGRLCHAAAGL
jgi:hypothetical protein